jgi:sigma-B regulation protein RsbU (phosphoserine phosphatase)
MPDTPLQATHPTKVLLIDDQRMVGEAIRRMLADIPQLEYRFCSDPACALSAASEFQPTVILQDLIMPGADGIQMVRDFRANAATSSTPLVVLSSKEEATTKAEAFAAGANDYLVKLPDKLELVARIRYHSAAYVSRIERDAAYAALQAQQKIIEQEIAEAAAYVRSLLPVPMAAASPVPSDWRFITSSSLGGDIFGYHWLTPHQLVMYLLDVCGHGVGSALLSVSAVNTIRSRTLPNADFTVPSQVLASLNRLFPMEEQNGKYFTMFYGVFDTQTRTLTHASAGHPPAVAIAPDGTATNLSSTGLMLGAFPSATYKDITTTLPAGTRLFMFSDGCYELTAPATGDAPGRLMSLADFTALLTERALHSDTLDRILAATQSWQQRPDFEDDFSLVEFHL